METEALAAQEPGRREENARKAKEFAGKEFPGERWIFVEAGIYLSPRRPVGEKSNYRDELRDAQILRDFGGTVYLCPENRYIQGRKYDAIVDGLKMEFKNMIGKSEDTLVEHFYRSRSQAPNVFINMEEAPLTKRRIISALYGARNSPKYDETLTPQILPLRASENSLKRRENTIKAEETRIFRLT
jgi:hypothetical protein